MQSRLYAAGVFDTWTKECVGAFCLLAFALSLAIFVDGYTFSRLGLRIPSWMTLATVVLLPIFLVVAVVPLGNWLLGASVGRFEAARANIGKLPVLLLLLNVLIAASEELLFRGYAIARLEDLTGSTVASVAISTIAFGLAHASRGLGFVLLGMIGGAIFSVAYLWRRDLLAVATAHFAFNVYIIASSQ